MKEHKKVSYAKYGYIFAIPFVLAFLLFTLYPLVYTLVIGFTNLQGAAPMTPKILEDPLQNFKEILAAPMFHTALKNTFFMWICNFIPQMSLALLLAAWFTSSTRKIAGQGLFKVLFYMPNIITAATIAVLFQALFNYPVGPVNDLLQRFGFIEQPINFMVNKASAKGVVIFIQTWMWYGNTMIVLISGILGISPDIFEAAEIDGANAVQRFFYVTVPNLKTIILYTLVTSLVGGLQMFDIPKLYLNGGPDNATMTTSVFLYEQAFAGRYMFNRAAAASVVMFVIIAIFSSMLFFLLRDKDEEALKKIIKKQEKEFKKKKKAEALAAKEGK